MFRRTLGVAALLLVVTLVSAQVQADSITVNATGMSSWAYYPQGWGSWVGDITVCTPEGGGSDAHTAFLVFDAIDFSGIGTIDSAYLTLSGDSGNGGDGDLTLGDTVVGEVYYVDSAWTLDGTTKPTSVGSPGTPDATHSVVGDYEGQADITDLVQAWKDGTYDQNGLGVSDPDGHWATSYYHLYRDLTHGVQTSITVNYQPAGGGGDVPEPGTLLLMGTGALGVLGFIKRRRMK